MARVLFVNIPAEGHVNPSLGLVKQLVDSGDEVVYLCTEEYRTKLRHTGAQFRAYPFDENIFAEFDFNLLEVKHPLQFTDFLLRGTIATHLPAILKLVEKDMFDYMIVDSSFGWGVHILSEVLRIPTVCSVTHFVFQEPINLLHLNPLDDQAGVDMEGIDLEALNERIKANSQAIAAKYNVAVPAIEDLYRQYGQLKLVFTSRYFQPDSEQFDDSFKFIGPSIVQRLDAPSFPLDLLRAQHQNVVYISMGTVLNKDLDLYELLFAAYQDIPAQFVLSCGKETDMGQLSDRIPDNFIVKPYVPQLEILQHADVFITHAGMNSTSEALYYNVPLVMIPLSSDQPIVAARVEELGAGIMLNKNNLTADDLKSTLLKVLNDSSYKERARLIGDSLRSSDGSKQAAQEIRAMFTAVR